MLVELFLPLWFLPAHRNIMMLAVIVVGVVVVMVVVVVVVVVLVGNWFRVVTRILYRTGLSVTSDDPESTSQGLKRTGNNAMIRIA